MVQGGSAASPRLAAPVPAAAKEEKAVKPLLAKRPRVKAKSAVKVAGLDNVLVRFRQVLFSRFPAKRSSVLSRRGGGSPSTAPTAPMPRGCSCRPKRGSRWSGIPLPSSFIRSKIGVEAFDRVGVFKDIIAQISETGTNVSAAKVSTKRGSSAFLGPGR